MPSSIQKITDLSEQDYKALLTALDHTALVSVTNAKGDIIFANETFIKVSKYSIEELIGQNHRILKSGHQPSEVFDELWKTISSGKVWRGEIKNRDKKGEYYWVDTSIAPILGPNHEPERYISVRFLITDKKRSEEEARIKAEELEKFNKLLVGRELKMAELKKQLADMQADSQKHGSEH